MMNVREFVGRCDLIIRQSVKELSFHSLLPTRISYQTLLALGLSLSHPRTHAVCDIYGLTLTILLHSFMVGESRMEFDLSQAPVMHFMKAQAQILVLWGLLCRQTEQ